MEADHTAQLAEAEAEAASADHAAQWAEADHAAAHDGLHAFALGLNKRLHDRSRNLAFSPLSVYVALSLGAAGAREGTLEELLGILGAPSRTSSSATSVRWPSRPLPTGPRREARASASHAACGTTRPCPSAQPTVTSPPSRTRPSLVPSTSAKR